MGQLSPVRGVLEHSGGREDEKAFLHQERIEDGMDLQG